MTNTTAPTPEAVADLKKRVRRLNSKAGQMKMDLHDLAEGLPTDYEKLIEEATKTYEIFHQHGGWTSGGNLRLSNRQLTELRKQLKTWEAQLQ
jgi:hypothetical protein